MIGSSIYRVYNDYYRVILPGDHMNLKELDEKLRQLNEIERDILRIRGSSCKDERMKKLKEYFSGRPQNGKWVISGDKIAGNSGAIAIHRHDRFTEFEKHRHDFLEMMFVYSGSIRQNVEGTELEIRKGEIILLDMNVEHSIEEAGEDDIGINILIKKEFFDWIFLSQIAYNDLISDFVVKALYGRGDAKRYIYFRTSENDRVWDIMISALMEFYEKRNGRETAIRAYILLLFNELLRDYEKYLPRGIVCQIDSSISAEIVSYIDSHSRDLNLKDMARRFNYNPDYFGKLVKKVTGRNLNELVKEQRLKKAEYLLKNTDIPVTEVVHEVGYSNVTYFYKQFREKLGTTPDEYRRKRARHL